MEEAKEEGDKDYNDKEREENQEEEEEEETAAQPIMAKSCKKPSRPTREVVVEGTWQASSRSSSHATIHYL